MTDRKRLESILAEMSFQDELTHLRNRRGFMTFAEQQLRAAQRTSTPVTCFFIDLNDMKRINDHNGHKTGDLALCDAAQILNETFRSADIIARLGGDEFAVLLTAASPDSAHTLIGRLQGEVQSFNDKRVRPYVLSMSVGLASFDPAHPKRIDELLSEADAQMYKAKRLAKHGVASADVDVQRGNSQGAGRSHSR